jgi:glycogen synthase
VGWWRSIAGPASVRPGGDPGNCNPLLRGIPLKITLAAQEWAAFSFQAGGLRLTPRCGAVAASSKGRLSAADIHVSASHHEGFPNNILEAMSAGLPVVATAVGGVPEQIIDGETGILVPPRDHAALASAIDALAADVAARQAMGRAGRST